MVSFIGDMWKCAVHIRNRFKDFGEEHVQIVNIHIDGKFVYIVCYPILNYDSSIALLNLDKMKKQKDIYENFLGFNVKCDYVIFNDMNNHSFTGVCIR